jgi:hypothetical protein
LQPFRTPNATKFRRDQRYTLTDAALVQAAGDNNSVRGNYRKVCDRCLKSTAYARDIPSGRQNRVGIGMGAMASLGITRGIVALNRGGLVMVGFGDPGWKDVIWKMQALNVRPC